MAEDWDAVARAINQRMKELDINQDELIKRSRLAKQTVGEIQNNTTKRTRNPHTLEALSTALELNGDHLAAVRDGRKPPMPDEPRVRPDDIFGRVDLLEYHMESRMEQMRKEIEALLEERFAELRKDLLTAFQQIYLRSRQTGR